MPDLNISLVMPLWNMVPPGRELLERIAGEVGLDRLTIPIITNRTRQFRLEWFPDAPYFQTEGGWHYRANAGLYAASGIRPRSAKWAPLEPLASIREQVQRLGVREFAFEIDWPDQSAPADSPMLQIDAWGSNDSVGRPCLNHPNVREAARVAIDELAQAGPVAIELKDWHLDRFRNEACGMPRAFEVLRWTRTCFCAACRQMAADQQADPDAAARDMRAWAGALFQKPASYSLAMPESEALDDYNLARGENFGGWLIRLAERGDGVRVLLQSSMMDVASTFMPMAGPLSFPFEPPGQRHSKPLGQLFRASCIRLKDLQREWASARTDFGNIDVLRLHAWHATNPSPDELVRVVSWAALQGVSSIECELLEEAPLEAITWLKQAVRYARRG